MPSALSLVAYQHLAVEIDSSQQPTDDDHPRAIDAWRDRAILALLCGDAPPRKKKEKAVVAERRQP
jgi:hypothetical protein